MLFVAIAFLPDAGF